MLTNNIQRVEFVVTGLIFTLTERFRYQRCSQAPIPLNDFQTCASIFSANTSTKSIAVVAEGFSLTVIHYAKGKVCVTPCYGRQASANRGQPIRFLHIRYTPDLVISAHFTDKQRRKHTYVLLLFSFFFPSLKGVPDCSLNNQDHLISWWGLYLRVQLAPKSGEFHML